MKEWVIVPYEEKDRNGKSFDEIFDFDLKNNTIALGARSLVNTSKNVPELTEEELRAEMKDLNPDYTERATKNKAKVIWRLYHEVKEDDVVIAKKGLSEMLAIGKVIMRDNRIAYYDKKLGLDRTGNLLNPYPNFLNVSWKKIFNYKFNDNVFRQGRFGLITEIVVKAKQPRYIPVIEERIRSVLNIK